MSSSHFQTFLLAINIKADIAMIIHANAGKSSQKINWRDYQPFGLTQHVNVCSWLTLTFSVESESILISQITSFILKCSFSVKLHLYLKVYIHLSLTTEWCISHTTRIISHYSHYTIIFFFLIVWVTYQILNRNKFGTIQFSWLKTTKYTHTMINYIIQWMVLAWSH